MDNCQLLLLMVPTELRDDVVDALMACEFISGFNMTGIAGYSKEHSQYDLREQVEGYREFFKFEVMHPAARQAALMDALRPACAVAGVRYWIVPLREQGHL
ncbi:MAG: DUF3240 family protein [Pseudomonadales bacterium]|nr:DUF3240 family protein [Halieaceae bacterium]MCP5164389.1 DUF3240 family protein [Pseudomonadales bacterium]MCP5189839.1 DUF3240 family protein [Pseudomonadales bacterium]